MIYNQIYAGLIYPKIIFDAHLQSEKFPGI